MGWGKKDKDDSDEVPMPRQCQHTWDDVVAWHPVQVDGKVKFFNGLCKCGIYARTKGV